MSLAPLALQLNIPRSLGSWNLRIIVHGARQQTYGLVLRPSVIAPHKRDPAIIRYPQFVCLLWCTRGRPTHIKAELEHPLRWMV